MYIDQPIRHFLDKLASKSPEPGGGSVAALTGSLGAGLVSMVCSLTLGKEKYKDVQPQVEALIKESEKLRGEMQDLIQKDTEVYGGLSEVYKMPKNTDAEKAARTAKMQEALKLACQVPFEIGLKSLEVAKLAQRAAEIGNVAAVSDAGVAVLLAQACAQSAALCAQACASSTATPASLTAATLPISAARWASLATSRDLSPISKGT